MFSMLRVPSISGSLKSASRTLITLRLASTLVFLESSRDGKVLQSSLSALSAAQQLGNPVTALFAGSSAATAAEELKSTGGSTLLKKIIVADSKTYDNYLPEALTPLALEILKDPEFSHFVVASSAVGKNLLPRVGALLDYQPICDVTKIVDSSTFIRPIYAGNALATVHCGQNKKLVSIRASSFPAASASATAASVTNAPEVQISDLTVQWESENLVKSARPDLGSASKVVSGGRGLKNKETFDKLVTPLADSLGAAIGATRAAVDSGFCDNSLQIGQTGKVVAPDLYIAVGISGAIQHLAGMKDSKVIVAINNDKEAPIFQVADYGLTGDLNEIVPELTEKLSLNK
ncbi:LANO_0C03290g1_1 [Lachancea nothofagi CBS 11611]|uniref:Probable electron transfer flavoprotein subunit alpha n=1 Tax=Lachancea nothofagi CBS 11611 TaxID=1266666 RepID=A0A1G4J5I5_9SACH|nr:LANO_0C03290g1_1 [Lachancea nothofagi CBS 11611]